MQQISSRGIREELRFSPTQEWLVRGLALLSLGYGLYWLWWRWTSTLNPNSIAFSLVLVLAETWAWIGAALFLFGVWKIPVRESPPPPKHKTVDVFITVFDEPLELVRRTAVGAKAIRYPHRTYFLDDGHRDELKRIAQELGVGYIRRVGHNNAKAGNLNEAMKHTTGEFILQLDADHYPLPNIVHELLGYFNDPKVAFIQTPQEFYNTDSFTHVVNDDVRELWEENRIFYCLLQPGKDNWNASFFCGCGGMLRRAALESIGGFQTQTIIEDMETSLTLQSQGWKSVYHPKALAFGLAPGSAIAFHTQRQRWAQGSMQMLRKYNPLFMRGLSPAQRASYLAANVYPFDGLQKLIFYAAPALFLLTGAFPVTATGPAILSRLLPYLILSIISFELLARGTGHLFISERFMMAKFWTYCWSLLAIFTTKALEFHVTPKGKGSVPFRTYAPQLVVLMVSLAAIIWAPLAHVYGWIDYDTREFGVAYAVSAFWALWNVVSAAQVVRMSLRGRAQRHDHRFLEHFTVRFRAVGETAWQLASVRDLNLQGLAFRSTTRFEPGTQLGFALPLSTGTVDASGNVVHVLALNTPHGTVYTHGIQFAPLGLDDRNAIEMHCIHSSVEIWRKRYRQTVDFFTWYNERVHNLRGERRRSVQLAARYSIDGAEDVAADHAGGLLDQLSPYGASLLVDKPIPPGSIVRFEVPGTALKGEGTVVSSYAMESAMHVRFSVGLSLNNGVRPERRHWARPATWLRPRRLDVLHAHEVVSS